MSKKSDMSELSEKAENLSFRARDLRKEIVGKKSKFKRPFRVDTWFERDRASVVVYDANDNVVAEWWDEDVGEMIESGYFSGSILGLGARMPSNQRAFSNSVLKYVEEVMGI